MPEQEWPPITAAEAGAAREASVAANGFVRLNKPALLALVTGLAEGRAASGARDAVVMVALLCVAEYSPAGAANPLAGCVLGADSRVAELIGVERSRFLRAVGSLVQQGYLDRLPDGGPKGYRVRRPVWLWLQDKSRPEAPAGLGPEFDPFAGTPYERSRRPGPREAGA